MKELFASYFIEALVVQTPVPGEADLTVHASTIVTPGQSWILLLDPLIRTLL